MLITRECDYAVRVVRALADGRRMSVGEICEKEFITAPFAYKILKKLQKAGIVKGFRGVHGGYSLNRGAKELTLYDVYTAIDPEFYIIDCLDPGYQCICNGSGNQACTVHGELQRVQKELCRMLQEKNLEDIFQLKNRNRL
nr:Rrf2 family transcriptional regulator [uncultured Blautia sp.]